MTKEEFDSLKIGDKVYCNGTTIRVCLLRTVYTELVNDIGKQKSEDNYITDELGVQRSRHVIELFVKDSLVDFLQSYYGNITRNEEAARQIRMLLGKKSKDLKFPTSEDYYDYVTSPKNAIDDTYNWFVEQVKKLNS
jgi:hypothetical protein